MKNPFHGLFVPLITPFKDGKVDYNALSALTEHCVENGADGFVCLGTTAETPTLTEDEKKCILFHCKVHCHQKPIIVGTGSNCTEEAVRLSLTFSDLGADGLLSVTPYYNKPPKSGIIAHFSKVAESVNLPIILYNVPSRTGIDMEVDTIKTLSQIDNVVGIKEAGSSEQKLEEIGKMTSESFGLFGGNDILIEKTLSSGAVGYISAAANAIPKVFSEILSHYYSGNKVQAFDKIKLAMPLIKWFYSETNPAPIKYYLSQKGQIKNEFRLPMCPISHKNEQLLNEIENLGGFYD